MGDNGPNEREAKRWPGAPSPESVGWWNLFIACGQVAYQMMEHHRARLHEGDPVLLEFMQRKAGDVAGLCPSQGEREAKEVLEIARAQRAAACGSPYVQRLAVSLLTRAPEETFPFLKNSASPIPAAGAFLAAALSAVQIFEGRSLREASVRRVLNLVDRRPHRWRDMGMELVDYCARPGALLAFGQPASGLYGLDDAVDLSPGGYAALLSVESPAEVSTGDRHWGEDGEIDRCSLRKIRFEKFLEGKQAKKGRRRESKEELSGTITDLTEPGHALDSLALPASVMEDLRLVAALCARVRDTAPTLLFHGLPGTGKTYGAAALAGTLKRPLATAALARIYNRYVGDTEKALESAFREAEAAGAVLLLDEADALLHARSGATHQWELASVNVLLKLLEKPAVPVVLCTNLLPQLDPALHRRIHHLLEFPQPGAKERSAIWALELKRAGFRKALDLRRLAEVSLTGGLIANAVAQARNRRLLLGSRFRATTEAMLELAWKEAPKLQGASCQPQRCVGFGA